MNIEQRPYRFTPSGNPIVYVVSDAAYTQSDFRYLAHIIIGGEETKLRKSPTNGQYQYFDFQNIVENYLEPTFNIGKPTAYYQANGGLSYEIQFGIYSGSTEYLLETETGITFNCSLDRNEFIDYEDTDYLFTPEAPFTGTSSTIGKFLTDYTEKDVSLLDKGRIGFLNYQDNAPTHIYYYCYDESDSLIGLYRITNPYTVMTQRIIVDFPSHPVDINFAASQSYVESGITSWSLYTGEVITEDVAYYRINAVYNYLTNSQIVSNTLTYTLKDKCSRFEKVNVGWLNKYGSFDYYYFNMKFVKNKSVERKEYTKKLGDLVGSKWSYVNDDFETVNYHNVLSYDYLLSTEYIDDEESMMIEDLTDSTQVYAEIGGEWVGVIITTENYMRQSYQNRDMNQWNIGLKLNYKNKTQRL